MNEIGLLTEAEAAKYLNFSQAFLKKSRYQGTGPKFVKGGRSVRYQLSDLLDWVEERKRKNTLRFKRSYP